MNQQSKTLLTIAIVLALGIIAWGALTMPDQRTVGQKIDDAVNTLPEGPAKAARQLENRTPGEKLGDAVKDAGEDIKRNTDN